ncbi:hypothetical protein TcWFU_000851 [Taenia crassiceps]|uniref:Uncharacterized protein n=1 Tax=Taenia crassiceps TaxID=6207 RepID=A0ABR4Q4Y6_9CEST
MNPTTTFESDAESLEGEEGTQCAPVGGTAAQPPATSSEGSADGDSSNVHNGENNVGDAIISEALLCAGVTPIVPVPPTLSSTVEPVDSTPVEITDNTAVQTTFCEAASTSSNVDNVSVPPVHVRIVRIVKIPPHFFPPPPHPPPHQQQRQHQNRYRPLQPKLSSLPPPHASECGERPSWEQVIPCYQKYMRFNDVNPNTAISVAIAAASTANEVNAASSNATDEHCRPLPRRRRRRRKCGRSDQSANDPMLGDPSFYSQQFVYDNQQYVFRREVEEEEEEEKEKEDAEYYYFVFNSRIEGGSRDSASSKAQLDIIGSHSIGGFIPPLSRSLSTGTAIAFRLLAVAGCNSSHHSHSDGNWRKLARSWRDGWAVGRRRRVVVVTRVAIDQVERQWV